ncbi:hypothetical protein BN871_AI_01260 [Paenibacillus sp. P22]|nr:hypothetical protein BN871_AI_01260 [Paenibacillus sp. P22]
MAKLAKRLGFNLADPLARDAEYLAYFLERPCPAVIEAEAQAENVLLPLRQRIQHILKLLLQQFVSGGIGRRESFLILDEIPQMRVILFPDRRFQRYRLLGNLHDLADLVRAEIHLGGNFLRRRFASELLQQLARDADQLVDRLHHVDRNTDGPGLVGDGAGNRLTNPPGRVRAELEAFLVIEFLDSLDETHVALLDQIQEQHAASDITLRDADDETKVGFRKTALRFFIAFLDTLGQLDLVIGQQKRDASDLLEIHADRIVDLDARRQRKIVVEVEIVAFAFLVFAAHRGRAVLGLVGHFDAEIVQLLKKFVDLLRLLVERSKLVDDFFIGQGRTLFALFNELVFHQLHFLFVVQLSMLVIRHIPDSLLPRNVRPAVSLAVFLGR